MAGMSRSAHGLIGHDQRMHDARPYREPDKRRVRDGVFCRAYEKNTQGRIDPDNHQKIVVSARTAFVPRPARGPNHRQWIDQTKYGTEQDQRAGQQSIAVRHLATPNLVWPSDGVTSCFKTGAIENGMLLPPQISSQNARRSNRHPWLGGPWLGGKGTSASVENPF